MKKLQLTSEQKEQMSYADVANLVLTENGSKMKIQDLFKAVIESMELPESYFESKIGDFFGLLSTDKRFMMLEKGFWDLRKNNASNVSILDADEDEEEEIVLEEEEMIEEESDEINYDDETVDDDDSDDDLKDLVIMDDGEEEQELI